MTTRAEFEKQYADSTPEERREKLDEIASGGYDTLDDDGKREHDALATLVAKDEEDSLNESKEEE
jgi:hypothetical protein